MPRSDSNSRATVRSHKQPRVEAMQCHCMVEIPSGFRDDAQLLQSLKMENKVRSVGPLHPHSGIMRYRGRRETNNFPTRA